MNRELYIFAATLANLLIRSGQHLTGDCVAGAMARVVEELRGDVELPPEVVEAACEAFFHQLNKKSPGDVGYYPDAIKAALRAALTTTEGR